MSDDLATVRRQLGELGAMSHQTTAMERTIKERAEKQLEAILAKLDAARAASMSGTDEDRAAYLDLVKERGHLEHVIASAREALT